MIDCTWLSGILVTSVWYFVGLTLSQQIKTKVSNKYVDFELGQNCTEERKYKKQIKE
jgi:hypothetical protein